MLQVVQSSRDLQLGLTGGKLPDDAHEWSMQRRWIVTPAGALQDKKSSLAILFARGLNSRFSQVVRPSYQLALFWKTWRISFLLQYKYPSYPRKIGASREKIERETLEKSKIDLSIIFT